MLSAEGGMGTTSPKSDVQGPKLGKTAYFSLISRIKFSFFVSEERRGEKAILSVPSVKSVVKIGKTVWVFVIFVAFC